MNRAIIVLLVSLGVAFGPAVSEALAASQRKKMVIAVGKKPVKSVARHKAYVHANGASVDDTRDLMLRSSSVLVQDQVTGAVLFEKNADAVVPIASLTKLMTAMVALDARLPLDEMLDIGKDDVDTLKGTHSRLRVGAILSREEMLRLALMSSENRAAAALSRHYPGGRDAFVAAMNQKAQALGLTDTRFSDSTGLTAANVSSARDLTRLVDAAHHYPLIREFSTTADYKVAIAGRPQMFRNTNSLVKSAAWEIGLSKTGYISEAGKCLVMQAWLNNKPMIIVLLDSWGRLTRIGDANRIKRWVESAALPQLQTAG
ncbi:MAG: D-alanyl-D-alanine endopeptidase [Candidatus Nitricoxidivorans perseverans]|uniref:D-alanyl-D-alanine endopeptidase n=1 Tax=Candidatus Nitricoxidivorans perseverans TaxID=2975601 RepID=A0AA49IY77_9PROT|nr:MAG: D-alanyl-D-alanine endopeptidase [Candidatus Nitricoxidivorans perseverans]